MEYVLSRTLSYLLVLKGELNTFAALYQLGQPLGTLGYLILLSYMLVDSKELRIFAAEICLDRVNYNGIDGVQRAEFLPEP